MRRVPRFRDSWVEEAIAIASFLGSTAFALVVMAGSIATSGVLTALRSGAKRRA